MRTIILTLSILFFGVASYAQENLGLKEKTLIVWTALDDNARQGGSALTIDDRNGNFDGIVYGEIENNKWMAGSNNFLRTQKEQQSYSVENAKPGEFVQIAVVYANDKITIYRNGKQYASYAADNPQTFGNSSSILFGKRHLENDKSEGTFSGKIKDARIYSSALNISDITSMKPGVESPVPGLWAWWNFTGGQIQEVTGRFDDVQIVGNISVKEGSLVLPGGGATLIASNSQRKDIVFEDGQNVPLKAIKATHALRERLLSDPYRPMYHFSFPEDDGRPGDPNGAFYHNGRYHLMFLYNATGSGFKWGHVSSKDMLNWRYHPDAIGPGDGDDGCFSGGGFVDDDGTAVISYWMLWDDKGIGLAKSNDYYFDKWEKFDENPVIKSTEWGVTEMKDPAGNDIHIGSADPSNIWKKDGKYYMLTGNLLVLNKYGRAENSPADEQGDRLYLFESENLKEWKYLHRFYESRREWTDASEDNMCPSFLPLPASPDGGAPSGKHLLLFISHNMGCQYYVGDYINDKFYPDNHGRMTWKDNSYFAPEALVDDKGRQIMWSWIFDDRPDSVRNYYGWTGTYGLPRTLWLGEDGTLRMRPVREIESLRMNEASVPGMKIGAGGEVKLNGLGKELMELEITFAPNKASRYGVKLGVSDDGREETIIYYDNTDKKLKFDTRKSSLEYGKKIIEEAPLELKEGESLTLRLFVDRSIIEVFANDRQAIGRMVYPTLKGKGITLFSEGGGAEAKSIKSWELSPSNPF